MKSTKGITLTSLIIYVIGMLVIVAVISTLTAYFSKNIDIKNMNSTTIQYTKFSSVFSDEINIKGNTVVECKTTGENLNKVSYIVFSSGNQYTYMGESNSIYKNKVKICEDIIDCDFTYNSLTKEIKLNFKTDSMNLSGDDAVTYKLQ